MNCTYVYVHIIMHSFYHLKNLADIHKSILSYTAYMCTVNQHAHIHTYVHTIILYVLYIQFSQFYIYIGFGKNIKCPFQKHLQKMKYSEQLIQNTVL